MAGKLSREAKMDFTCFNIAAVIVMICHYSSCDRHPVVFIWRTLLCFCFIACNWLFDYYDLVYIDKVKWKHFLCVLKMKLFPSFLCIEVKDMTNLSFIWFFLFVLYLINILWSAVLITIDLNCFKFLAIG